MGRKYGGGEMSKLKALYMPTFICPDTLIKPKQAFINYGFSIPMQHILSPRNPKAIVIFIGGFWDTIMCAVYREFEVFNTPSCIKIYASFDSSTLFSTYLKSLCAYQLPLFVIAHSWGGSNFYKALQHSLDTPLHYLLTLDPVGYHTPKIRPPYLQKWENVYIADKPSYLRRTNIIALIGHAWNAIPLSDTNIPLYKPAHHASISPMIAASSFGLELKKIIKL